MSHYEYIAIDKLMIDPTVQRVEGTSDLRVQRIAKKFDEKLLGTITVAPRPGGMYAVLDGAHRVAACRIVGCPGLWSLVHEEVSIQRQAAIFNGLNSGKAPSYISRLLARAKAGEPEATEIVKTVEGHGWRFGTSNDAGVLAAASAAERVYINGAGSLPDGRHPGVLDKTLALITSAWGYEADGPHATILMGTGQLYGRFGEAVETDRLATLLAKERPRHLVAKAKGLQSVQGGTNSAAFAKLTVAIYNNRRRVNLLPEWVWTR